jgi:tRNA threonylcarbamoyladenosine biosynthesis protein TsaE
VNEYQGRVPLYHLDLYRLKGPDELESIGFDEYIESDGVTVIEWAERAADELPVENLSVYFSYVGETSREIGFRGDGERYEKLLVELKQNISV